ncbi:hypothetical protein H6F50_09120 [Coleofasciculus sp. FACHB-712]|uniref:hypothetical protein n=1 Tax=Coleofasciculus sp. FACHB-712 TaxID=2692789 RepID=UPI001687F90B|nr:hypothetical protein [Coleofasciculus sp. FACHB-712]MBD1942514.1 hypothetical protein [Coleofasciculus sp. FACHB-712]
MARYSQTGGGQAPQSTYSYSGGVPRNPNKFHINARLIAKILVWGTIGFVGLLNVQPWIELARHISKELTNIPFLDSLVRVPFLGGWIEWGFANIIPFMAIVMWGMCQLKEILPSLVENPTDEAYRNRWIAYGFEAIICFLRFPPYEGGVQAIVEDAPNWDSSLILWWTLVLFLVTMFSFEMVFNLRKNIQANFR